MEPEVNIEQLIKEKKSLIDQLRSSTKDVSNDMSDHLLLKYLIFGKYDVKQAEKHLRKAADYFKKVDVKKLVATYKPPEVIKKYYPGGFCGEDKAGRPVWIEPFGNIDLKGILYSCSMSDLEKTNILNYEWIKRHNEEKTKKTGKIVDGFIVIFVMEGVSRDMLWLQGLKSYLALVNFADELYPESMKRMFVVQAPRIFKLLWGACRPFMSEHIYNKINVLDANYSEVLLRYIDKDQLPVFLGGKMVDEAGDPKCSKKIGQGGKVPKELYLSELMNKQRMTSVTIAKGQKLELDFDVKEDNMEISYEFKLEKGDIGFAVSRLVKGTKEIVVPLTLVECSMAPEAGFVYCDVKGKYTVVFDNSQSKMAADKKLLYYLSVEQPIIGLDDWNRLK